MNCIGCGKYLEDNLSEYCTVACYETTNLEKAHNHITGSTRNPWLNQVLSKIAQLHDKKNHDYCPDDNNPFFNFEVSAKYAQASNPLEPNVPEGYDLQNSSIDSFNILLGIKLARLYALLTRGAQPNNEAFVDSEWDYVVYFLLRESYKLKLEEEEAKVAVSYKPSL